MSRVLVSIVNWNTRAQLRNCLHALQRSAHPVDVVVVDNASSDGSADMVAAEFPDVRLIRSPVNVGFAGGNNLALREAAAEFVLVLNPDVEAGPYTIGSLVEFLERTPSAAAVAPLLTGEDGRPQTHLYRRFPSFAQVALFWTPLRPIANRIPALRRKYFEHDLRGDAPVAVEQIPGAAMLLRRSALSDIGLLDAAYFVWWEDVDWCYRATQAGCTVHVLPGVTCSHEGGASFGAWSVETRVFQFYRAFYRFLARHHLHVLARRITPIILADLAWKDAILRLRTPGSAGLRETRSAVRRIAAGIPFGRVPDFHSASPEPDVLPRSRPSSGAGADIDVVIVNWNGRRWLPRCIAALQRSTVPIRIIVVDNASTDGSAEYLRTLNPDVHLIEAPANAGYAGGANLGLAQVTGRYAFVMNPDVLVAPDHLEVLRERLERDPATGAAQGKLFRLTPQEFEDGTPPGDVLDSAGHAMHRSRMVTDRGQGCIDGPGYDRECSVFSACGAAVLLRSAMLEDVAVGGEIFAGSFFAYKEDIDLGWRARLLGWDIRYVPAAIAHHVRGLPHAADAWRRIPVAARRHSWKNHYLLMLRNDNVYDMARALPFIAGWEMLRLGHALLRDPAVLPAYVDAARALPAALRARRELMSRRRVSRQAMRPWFRETSSHSSSMQQEQHTLTVTA